MCGLAGFVGAGDTDDLATMTALLTHRGPDGEGFYVNEEERTYLGHRRLVVLDPAGGAQPMWNEDGQVGVVCNGEIYNHEALRKELIGLGHHFASSHSDTEVLVHGYEAWGEELPERLDGMFAFVILDRPHRRLFLARDRCGEKPLYYTRQPNFFAFASELWALTGHGGWRRDVDEVALQKFWAYGYIPSPRTWYAGCAKLPPGSWLSYRLDTGFARSKRYWRYRLHPDPDLLRVGVGELAEQLRSLLAQAVQRRSQSDVPLGVFLSGGIDSASILALSSQASGGAGMTAFTIGFEDPTCDESFQAQRAAGHCGAEHHLRRLDWTRAAAMIPQILGGMDEPLADASLIATSWVSRFARERVTVALSGDGGDELLAGYDPFLALGLSSWYGRLIPLSIRGGIRDLVTRIPPSSGHRSWDHRLRRLVTGLAYPPSCWAPVWLGSLDPGRMGMLFEQPLDPEELLEEAISLWEEGDADDPVSRLLEFYGNFYLPENILMKVDRASMQVGLESRAVFLDRDLVDFCLSLPNSYKVAGRERKVLLRRAMRGRLPDELLDAPKRGFGVPLAAWLRRMVPPTGDLPGGMLWDGLRRCWEEHRTGRRDHRQVLWSWLVIDALYHRPPPARRAMPSEVAGGRGS